MKIREYRNEIDFNCIRSWVQDEKTHYLWCAARFKYPLEQDNFDSVLDLHSRDYGDNAYIITDENDRQIGFFLCSVNGIDNSAFLKFIILDNTLRGMGYGTEMMQFIAEYFSSKKQVSLLRLIVFDVNKPARKCYEKAGFILESEEMDTFMFKDEKWGRCKMIKPL